MIARSLKIALGMLAVSVAVGAHAQEQVLSNSVRVGYYYVTYDTHADNIHGPFVPAGVNLKVQDVATPYFAYVRRLTSHFSVELAVGAPPLTKTEGKGPAKLGSVPYNGQVITTARWLAPTPLFLEFGAELGRGANFPGAERNKNGSGRGAIFAHAGGDWGDSSSWRAGLSYMQTSPRDRTDDTIDLAGNDVTNAFSGKSRLWVADLVWKWAPNGNPTRQNFKLQTEYFQRRERGALTYDLTGVAATDAYSSRQSGAYVQAVYQFLPRWRTGVRYDRLDSGTVDLATNAIFLDSTNTRPSRVTWMADYNSSEFSRIRLQIAHDRARGEGKADNQVFVQYQMSLGAHGAHMF